MLNEIMLSQQILGMTPKRILVVDDEPLLRKMLLKIVSKTIHEGHEAENGLIALEMHEAEPFDLIILDLRMPKMGGQEFLEEAKARGLCLNVIMLTGHGEIDDAYELLSLYRIHDFIQKPLQNPFQLIFGINNALEKRKAENQLKSTNQQLEAEVERRTQVEADLVVRSKQIQDLLEKSQHLNQFVNQQNEKLQASRELLVEQKREISIERKRLAEEILRLKVLLEKVQTSHLKERQWMFRFFDKLAQYAGGSSQHEVNLVGLPEWLPYLIAQIQNLAALSDAETDELMPDAIQQRLTSWVRDTRVIWHRDGVSLASGQAEKLRLCSDLWRFSLQNLVFALQLMYPKSQIRLQIQPLTDCGLTCRLDVISEQVDAPLMAVFEGAELILSMVRWLLNDRGSGCTVDDWSMPKSVMFTLPFAEVTTDGEQVSQAGDSQPQIVESQPLLLFDTDVLRAFRSAFDLGRQGFEVRIADNWDLVEMNLQEVPVPSAVLLAYNHEQPRPKAFIKRFKQLLAGKTPLFLLSFASEGSSVVALESCGVAGTKADIDLEKMSHGLGLKGITPDQDALC